MKHLKKFLSNSDVKVYAKPNVVLLEDTGSIIYNADIVQGVFAQHIDGRLFTADEWVANGFTREDANGIAVCMPEASFVMNINAYPITVKWCDFDSYKLIDGVVATDNASAAMLDYLGEGNTAKIALATKDSAAKRCVMRTFPNGKKGYLGSLGEWRVAVANFVSIKEVYKAITGNSHMPGGRFWTSTQYSQDKAWVIGWNNEISKEEKGRNTGVDAPDFINFTTL